MACPEAHPTRPKVGSFQTKAEQFLIMCELLHKGSRRYRAYKKLILGQTLAAIRP
jgi:hypothetical protein